MIEDRADIVVGYVLPIARVVCGALALPAEGHTIEDATDIKSATCLMLWVGGAAYALNIANGYLASEGSYRGAGRN